MKSNRRMIIYPYSAIVMHAPQLAYSHKPYIVAPKKPWADREPSLLAVAITGALMTTIMVLTALR